MSRKEEEEGKEKGGKYDGGLSNIYQT